MQTIIEALELEIPQGPLCHGRITPDSKPAYCKYYELRPIHTGPDGFLRGNYCNLQEEYIDKKACGINE